jgi:uncharacterized membrane protein
VFGADEGIILDIEAWKVVLAASLVVVASLLYRRTYPIISVRRRVLLGFLRSAGFCMLVLFALNPALVSIRKDVREALVLVLVDVSKSMSIRDCNGRSRIEEANARIERFHSAITGLSDAEIAVVPFSNGLAEGAVRVDSILEASGEGTDIIGAVNAAERRYRYKKLAGIVLLTDGRISRGMTTSGAGISVPVFAVGLGDTVEGADIAVDEVLYDRVAYAGTETKIEAVVRASGFRGKTVELQLSRGENVVDSAVLTIRADVQELQSVLSYTPLDAGDHTLTVRAAPQAGEERDENNSETIRIKVRKSRIRFLYIDQFADWNMTFIRDIVQRTKRFEMETVTWAPGRDFTVLPGRRAWEFPVSTSGLKHYDLVVVSDDVKHFNRGGEVGILGEYVVGGGALLLLADERSPLVSASAMSLMESFLPVRALRAPTLRPGEYNVRVAPGGDESPLAVSLSDDVNLDALPPLLAGVDGIEVTAGSRIVLSMSNGNQSSPFVVLQRHGKGLVAVVLGMPVWRWKLAGADGEQAYQKLFSGLIQHLAEGAESSVLELDSDMTVYRAGDRPGLTVHLVHNRFVEGVRGEVLRMENGEETLERTFLFEPAPRRNGMYRAGIDPLPPGDYRITATEIKSSGSGLTGDVRISVLPVSVEFLNTARDVSLLSRIAGISGGITVEPDGLAALAGEMDLRKDTVERREIRSLRDTPLFFLVIIAFFAAEWIFRKAWGLV